MSQTIDSKVVEMQFDNKNFENNVQTSLSSLDKLKKSLDLNEAAKGLNGIDKAAANIDFTKMSNSLSFLEKRFSTIGIIGMRVIENLTDSVMGFVNKTVGAVFNQMKQGGIKRAMSIENARFQLQGLFDDQAKVNAIMQDALDSVDGTAYAYDSAALAASQFAATGIEAGERLQKALRGITGVAAMANADYESISGIFTAIAGNGRVMGMQLQQLSLRGLNAASTLANFFNTIDDGTHNASEGVRAAVKELTNGAKVSEGDIRDFVSKGKISFDIFSEAMDDAFGKHAKKANDTLSGSFANMKAAISRIGAEFVQPMIGQNGPLVQLFNALRVQINQIKKLIVPFAKITTDNLNSVILSITDFVNGIDIASKVEKFQNALNPIKVLDEEDIRNLRLGEKELNVFGKLLTKVAKDHGIAIDSMIGKDGNWIDSLKEGWLTADIFNEALQELFGMDSKIVETTSNLKELRDIAVDVIRGDYGNGAPRVDALTAAGYNYDTVQDYVNKVHELTGGTWQLTDAVLDAADAAVSGSVGIEKMTEQQMTWAGYTEEEIDLLRTLGETAKTTGTPLYELIENLNNPLYGLKMLVKEARDAFFTFLPVAKEVGKAWKDVFPMAVTKRVYDAINIFGTISKKFKPSQKTLDRIHTGVVVLFSAFVTLSDFVSAFAKITLPILGKAVGYTLYGLLRLLDHLWTFGTYLGRVLNEADLVNTVFIPFAKVLETVIDVVFEGAKAFADFLRNNVDLEKAIKDTTNFVVNFRNKSVSAIDTLKKKIGPISKGASGFTKTLISIYNVLKSVFSTFIGYASEIYTKYDLGTKFVALLKVVGILGKELVKCFGAGLESVIKFVSGLDKISFDNIDIDFGTITSKILDYFTSGKALENLKKAITAFVNGFKDLKKQLVKSGAWVDSGLGTISDAITKFFSGIKKFFDGIDTGSIIATIMSFLTIFTVGGIYQLITKAIAIASKIASALTIFQDIGTGIYNVLSAYAKKINAETLTIKVNALVKVIFAIVALAAVLIIIGRQPLGTIAKGLGVIAAIFVAVVVIVKITKEINVPAMAAISGILIAFAAIMASIGIVIAIISSIDPKTHNVFGILGYIALVLAALVVVVYSLSKFKGSGDKWKPQVAMLLGVSGALLLVALALKTLAEADLKHPVAAILMLTITVGLIIALLHTIKKIVGVDLASILAIVAVASSLALLVKVIKTIAMMKPSAYLKGLLGLIPIMAAMYAVLKITQIAGEEAKKAGISVLAIGAALVLMSLAVKVLADLAVKNPVGMVAGIVALIALIAGIKMLFKDTVDAGANAIKAGVMVLAISAALILMSLSLKILASIDVLKLIATVAMLSVLMLTLGAVVKSAASVSPNAKTVIALAILLGTLAAALAILTLVKPGRLLFSVIAMIAIMAALSAVINSIGKTKYLFKSSLVALGLVIGIVALLAVIVGVLSTIVNPNGVLGTAIGLAALLLAVSAAMVILTHLPQISPIEAGKAALSLMAFVGVITGISLVLGAISKFIVGTENMTKLFDSAAFVLEKIGGLLGSFLHGIISAVTGESDKTDEVSEQVGEKKSLIDTVIDGLNSISTALGGINFDNFDNLEKLGSAIESISTGFIVERIASFGSEKSSFERFAEASSSLGTALTNFQTAISGVEVDDGKIETATKLLSGLAQMASTDIPKKSWFFGGMAVDMSGFGENLDDLAVGLCDFFNTLQEKCPDGIDKGVVDNARIMLDGLAKMASTNIPESNWLGKSSVDIDGFGKQLKPLAEGLSNFYSTVSEAEIKKDTVDDARRMLDGLAVMASTDIPTEGLFGGKLSNMRTFSTNLEPLATGLCSFFSIIQQKCPDGIDKGVVDNARVMLDGLSKMVSSNISEEGSIFGFLLGSQSGGMKNFAKALPELATGLSDFVTNLGSNTTYPPIMDDVGQMVDKIEYVLGKDETINYDKATKVGGGLAQIGSYISRFSQNVTGVDTALLQSVGSFMTQLRLMLNSMSTANVDSVKKVQEVLDALGNLSVDKLLEALRSRRDEVEYAAFNLTSALANAFSKAPDLTTSIDSFIAGIKRQFENRSETFNGIGKNLAKNIGSGLSSGLSGAASMSNAGEAASKAFAAVSDTVGDYGDVGVQAMSNFASGIADGSSGVKTAVSKVALETVSTVRSISVSGFTGAGKLVVLGFANGISSNTFIATAKAKAMAEKAKEAARKALNIQSPSKEFYKIGDYAVQGFANAFSDGNDLSYDSGFELANRARVGLGSALTKISSLIENGIDTQPTIRPVLDLSDVENGASTLGGMLNLNPSVGVSNNLGAIGNYMMFRNQNATNDDVVAAIKQLQKNLGPMGDNITINGVTYDDGSNINDAVRSIIRAARVERRA